MWPFSNKKIPVPARKLRFYKSLETVTVKVAEYEFTAFLSTGEKFTGNLRSHPYSLSFKRFSPYTGEEYLEIGHGYIVPDEDRSNTLDIQTYVDYPTDAYVHKQLQPYQVASSYNGYKNIYRFETIDGKIVEFEGHLLHHVEYDVMNSYVDFEVSQAKVVEITDGK